jgi:uncharacterized protein (TIGR00661 family)
MSEVVFLRKPMLALPLLGQFEQEMNARYLERLGYGARSRALDEPSLEKFLEREPDYTTALEHSEQRDNTEALETVDQSVAEVMKERQR